ncbi:niban-like protein 2 isoform X2 [Apteryx rowi]|uniref:niban-like protein 2 isoform X2 n=1 Tax=Apteryx rowi TaxID=308060 RepID=UPI000E1CB6E2|nr:niban-like protein 2 isoform X2 [Apteryx rowi]
MGGRYSSPLSGKQRRYLRGCTAAMMKNFLPYYQRQLATAFLQQVSGELDLQGKLALQLLQSKTQRAPHATLYDGLLSQYDEDSQRWKENYFVLLGDFTLEWFESKEALGKGCEPRDSTALSGYLLLTSLNEYTKLVSSLCQGFAGGYSQQGWNTLADSPGEFLFFLYHPFRRHFCFCTSSAESQRIWKSALQDGIRYHSTELQRRGSFEAEAFLEAVRFYRQERGSYRAGDLLLGAEPEILGNVLMEDLLPVLRSQVLPHIRGSEPRRKQLWIQFLQEAYTLILSQVSSEFKVFQREKEKLQIQLEKKIRPDLDQMLTLKDQIARKLQGAVQSPAESCCCQGVEPDLVCVMEELMRPISSGAEMVRSLFAQRVDEMVRTVRNSPIAVLQKELLTLGRTSWTPEIMQPCYEKADVYKESLQGLERFGFHSVTSLVLGAQNLMQQQLSEQRLSQATNRNQVVQMLENVKDRVLKKFDYDSSSTRKQFAQEWLVQIFLPFLLKHLESRCKLELPKYESYVFADFSGIINVENIYEEVVLAVLLKAISKALKEASGRNKHNLYRDSFFCVLESTDDLLHEVTAQELSGIRMGALSSNSMLDAVTFPTCPVNKSASGEKIW